MKSSSLALATALSLMAATAFAQPGPPPGPGPGPGPGPQGPARHGRAADPAQMAQRHAQQLRDLLQLRPDQEPALQALIASMQPPPGGMMPMQPDGDAMRKLTTPERLDRMQALMAEHQAMFQRHAQAIRTFYAQLTPAQQKAFDALPMMDHGMMGHGMTGHQGRGLMMKHAGHGPGRPGMRSMPAPEGARGHPGMAPSKPPGAW